MGEIEVFKYLAGIRTIGSPLDSGSNISITGNEKGELMKKHDIKPGTPEWFSLWFSLPYFKKNDDIPPFRSKK